MNALLESPTAAIAVGLLLITMGVIVYTQTRTRGSLVILAATVLLAIGGVAAERAYVTPRESVKLAVSQLFDAIAADDLRGVLATIDASAVDMRSDAEMLMPMFRIESAGEGGEVRVELPDDPSEEGAIATASLKPLIKVQHTSSGQTGAYFDNLDLVLVRRGDKWLLQSYQPAKGQDWRQGASKLGR